MLNADLHEVSASAIFSGYPTGIINRLEPQVEKGLEFILRHLEPPDCPRNISTRLTDNKQITVYSRIEALSYFKDANYLDCRVSAYAPDSKRLSIAMIDIDLENFKSKREFNKAHVETLSNIYSAFGKRRTLSISPVTVLFTGNGNHYLIPLKPISANKANCKEFLQFIERYLSNGKCDEQHNKVTSLKNCLLRIPGSINSDGMAQVKILEKWDGKSKLDSSPIYQKFQHDHYRRLTKKVVRPATLINNPKLARQTKVIEQFLEQRKHNEKTGDNIILWIERLLKTPIPDHRKYCIWRILAPYFINVKRLSFDESHNKIYHCLARCNELKELDFDPATKIDDSLNRAADSGYLPISFDNPSKEPRTLKTDNKGLYNIIKTNYSMKSQASQSSSTMPL